MAKAKRGQSTEEWDFNESQVYQPSSRFKDVIYELEIDNFID